MFTVLILTVCKFLALQLLYLKIWNIIIVYIYIRKQIKFSAGKAFTCEKYHKNTQGKILADLKKGKTRRNYFFLQTTPLWIVRDLKSSTYNCKISLQVINITLTHYKHFKRIWRKFHFDLLKIFIIFLSSNVF